MGEVIEFPHGLHPLFVCFMKEKAKVLAVLASCLPPWGSQWKLGGVPLQAQAGLCGPWSSVLPSSGWADHTGLLWEPAPADQQLELGLSWILQYSCQSFGSGCVWDRAGRTLWFGPHLSSALCLVRTQKGSGYEACTWRWRFSSNCGLSVCDFTINPAEWMAHGSWPPSSLCSDTLPAFCPLASVSFYCQAHQSAFSLMSLSSCLFCLSSFLSLLWPSSATL
jgi:hypothetical protein